MAVPTVLVVEDERFVRDMIARDLQEAGYEVLTADTGAQAIALLELDGPIDCLVTDVRLPGVFDGWSVAERFRESDPGIPVIYTTAFGGSDPRRVEPSIILGKPYRPAALLDALGSLGVRAR